MNRAKIKNERLIRIYALANALNDATDDYAVTISLRKHDVDVHITELVDDVLGRAIVYSYDPDCGYERTGQGFDVYEDDENLTKAEAALLELLGRAGGDV